MHKTFVSLTLGDIQVLWVVMASVTHGYYSLQTLTLASKGTKGVFTWPELFLLQGHTEFVRNAHQNEVNKYFILYTLPFNLKQQSHDVAHHLFMTNQKGKTCLAFMTKFGCLWEYLKVIIHWNDSKTACCTIQVQRIIHLSFIFYFQNVEFSLKSLHI